MVAVPRKTATASLLGLLFHLALHRGALAWTPIDYVDPGYAISNHSSADTSAAQGAIIQAADQAAAHGPWSAQSGDIKASSGDITDYFSWSEIHEDCQNSSIANSAPSSSTISSLTTSSLSGNATSTGDTAYAAETTMPASSDRRKRSHPKRMDDMTPQPSSPSATASSGSQASSNTSGDTGDETPAPWVDVASPDNATGDQGLFGHRNGHNAARKTSIVASSQKATNAATSSPTSATTTASTASASACSTSSNGAQANQSLNGPRAMDESPDGIFINAVAYALTSKQVYADTAISFLRTLFIDKPIHPSATYAGVPPNSANGTGTIEGLMDFRGLVKISNALSILRQTGKMDGEVDEGVKDWSGRFLSWLEESDRGRNASETKGHLATIYHAQRVSLHLIMRHEGSAKAVLEQFFKSVWVDQVDQDGRQKYEDGPGAFESACLNLQGVMSMAKIGTTLGADYWHDGSSSGGSIKSGVDYLLRTTSGGNDQLLSPHVASVKAVYGDSDGIYAAFLEGRGGDYKRQPWWFFDQPEALHSTASARSQQEITPASSGSGTSAGANNTDFSTSSTLSSTTAGASENETSQIQPTSTSQSNPTKRSTLEASQAAEAKVIIELGHMNPVTSSRMATSPTRSTPPSTVSTSSIMPTSANPTRMSANPTSTSSVPVFQTLPGPVPPSPPNDECRASDSATCVYSWSSTPAASSSATPAGIRVEAEQSARVKLIT